MHRLLRPRDVRLHHRFHVSLDLLQRLGVRRFKAAANSRVNLFEQSVRLPVQFIPVQTQNIVQLRLEPADRLLLHSVNPRRELLQPLRRLICPRQHLFQLLRVLAKRSLYRRSLRRALLLQLLAQHTLRLCEGRAHLLLDLVQHRAQRILMCPGHFFSAPNLFLRLLPCRFQPGRCFGLYLVRAGSQLCRRFFRLRAHRLQSFLRRRQLLFVLVALQRAFSRQVRHQFMCQLFQLRGQPSRQFLFQRFRGRSLCRPRAYFALFLNRTDGMRRFLRYLFPETRIFPLPLFRALLAFRVHRVRGSFFRCVLNLLLCFRKQSR